MVDQNVSGRSVEKSIRIGIDATNIRIGGGITHLLEFLSALDPESMRVKEVVIWGGSKTLQSLPNALWMQKINPASLDKGLMWRVLWQLFCLTRAAKQCNCDVLFIPGGSYLGGFHPVVSMNQNLFPFEWGMIKKEGLSLRAIKFLLLRWVQSYTYAHSDGVIFLTEHAKKVVLQVTGVLPGKTAVIAHGLNPRFQYRPKSQRSIDSYSVDTPFKLLYVSTIDIYKNQDHVIRAVEKLRKAGYPLSLTLIGPADPKSLTRLHHMQALVDPTGEWLHYLGALPYALLHDEYDKADLGVFASSCETFGMTVLEKMAAGLPVACSNQSAMHEILGDGGLYFDPNDVQSIADAIERYLQSPQLRDENQKIAYQHSLNFSWKQCANKTIEFFHALV